jgi:hypothetical protein
MSLRTVLLVLFGAASSLPASAGISGRVIEAGSLRPVADATVVAVSGQDGTSTDSAGYFVLSVGPGTHLVYAYAHGLSAEPRPVSVVRDQLTKDVTLILDSVRTDDSPQSAARLGPNVRADYHITGRGAGRGAAVSVTSKVETPEGGDEPAAAGRAYRMSIRAVHSVPIADLRIGAASGRFTEGLQDGTQYMSAYLSGKTGGGRTDANRKTVAVAVAAATTGVVTGMVLATRPEYKGELLPALPIGLVSLLAALVPPRVEAPLRLWDDGRTTLTFEYAGVPLPTPVAEYKSRWSRSYVPDAYVCGFYLGCRDRNARSRRETLLWGGATWALLSAVALVNYAVTR